MNFADARRNPARRRGAAENIRPEGVAIAVAESAESAGSAELMTRTAACTPRIGLRVKFPPALAASGLAFRSTARSRGPRPQGPRAAPFALGAVRLGGRGFTLVELMIVVAIVAILAAIAYPSYTEYVRKGRRAEARTALTELLQQQERYLTQRNCYLPFSNSNGTVAATAPTPAGSCGGTMPAVVPFKTFAGSTNAAGASYWLSAEACTDPATAAVLPTADCIRVVARPLRDDPEAGDLRVTSTGIKSCTGSKYDIPGYCWP